MGRAHAGEAERFFHGEDIAEDNIHGIAIGLRNWFEQKLGELKAHDTTPSRESKPSATGALPSDQSDDYKPLKFPGVEK
jgi:hypothetical protein